MNMPREKQATTQERPIVRFGLGLANWSERWFPDPLIFALLGIVVVFIVGLLLRQSPTKLAIQGGKNFWSLVPFTMQMVMIIIGGYVVASTPIVYPAIRALAGIPKTPRGAVALVALFSMLTSLISWGLSLIFSELFVRELVHRVKGMDCRAAGAPAYLGLGAVWAMGLSSSAAMLMATKSAMPPSLFSISGLIPLTNPLLVAKHRDDAHLDRAIGADRLCLYALARKRQNRRILWHPIQAHSLQPGGQKQARRMAGIQPTADNFGRRALVLVSHRRIPHLTARPIGSAGPEYSQSHVHYGWAFVALASEALYPQFPFYAVIFGMIVGTGIADALAKLFASISTHNTYPLLVAAYSAVLGVFIPSGGSKSVIEAPYVLQAAILHQVHLGWVVQIYNASEALPNLVNPFWMLPLLGILKLKARDIVGYGVLQLIVHIPVVFFLCWLFARYIPYVPPIK
jgi:short-chain fatty acids transporter